MGVAWISGISFPIAAKTFAEPWPWIYLRQGLKRKRREVPSPKNKQQAIGGYAPGNYQKWCRSCNDVFLGDIKAKECYECATGQKKKKKKNKFNNKKVLSGGHLYESNMEKETGHDYQWRMKAGEVISFENQHRFHLKVHGITVCTYKIDFRAVIAPGVVKNFPNGCIDYDETKGFKTEAWGIKWNLTKVLFHELTIGEDARLLLNGKVIMESHK